MKFSVYKDGHKRDIEYLATTHFIPEDLSKKYDCKYCLYFLGTHRGTCVCNQSVCPAEECGYDARTADAWYDRLLRRA